MIAVKCRGVEATIRLNWPAVFAELNNVVSHDILPDLQARPVRFNPPARQPQSLTRRRITFMLRPPVFWTNQSRNHALTDRFPTTLFRTLALTLAISTVASFPAARAQSVSEGQRLAFDRSKGNCLTCHEIKGGDLPGTIGPVLRDIKSKYPDRNDLVAILTDETRRNPQTVMPPFGRNRILTEQEINAIVDFLQTL